MKHRVAPETLVVTDHAVLRYLERVQGQPIEAVREHIRKTCEGAAALGAVCVRAEGHRFELSNGRVTTVAPDHQHPNRTARKLAQERLAR